MHDDVAAVSAILSRGRASVVKWLMYVPGVQYRDNPGTITSDGNDGLTLQPADVLPVGSFSVTSGPCTVSRGGRCVGRRYSEQDSWPISSGIAPIAERCEIVVINAGGFHVYRLGASPARPSCRAQRAVPSRAQSRPLRVCNLDPYLVSRLLSLASPGPH